MIFYGFCDYSPFNLFCNFVAIEKQEKMIDELRHKIEEMREAQ